MPVAINKNLDRRPDVADKGHPAIHLIFAAPAAACMNIDFFGPGHQQNILPPSHTLAAFANPNVVFANSHLIRPRHLGRKEVRSADETGDELVHRLLVDFDWPAGLLHPSGAHDHDIIRHGHGLGLVVSHDDGGYVQLLLQLAQLDLHRLAQVRVQRGHRLVEQEDLRVQRQSSRNGDPLALSARQLADATILDSRQVNHVQQFADPVLAF